jgi:hypothetical protein
MDAFAGTHYQEALTHFKGVLVVDNQADKSRALGIACAVEIGDTTAVTNLSSSFNDPNGRWAKWANAKVALSTGSVVQATAVLVDLATNNSFFAGTAYISRGSHIWRQIDWSKFDDLTNASLVSSAAAKASQHQPP